jgi:hypothetical protein
MYQRRIEMSTKDAVKRYTPTIEAERLNFGILLLKRLSG